MGVTPQAPSPICPGSGLVVALPPDWPGNSYERPCPVCGDYVAAPPPRGRIRKHVAGKDRSVEEPESAPASGCRALYRLLAAWVLREASTPDSA